MTSVAFAPAPRTRLRLTRRGRRVLAGLVALPVAAALGFAVLAGGSAIATGVASDAEFATVTVLPGDTLWSIAESVAPGADPRDVVYAMSRLNVIDGGVLVPGQELAIPAQYAPTGSD